ncbi:MAG: hypothetical protein A2015_02895 [Spirochaetes bacterium GWF1_31_7]|nr:MAG: hypothetical protein A2Y30_12275 [Spirochaetes bacterium GWE1_32_154]OHD46125.1 MAG: hypothetical protein A2Y29_06985 [Spirochaetes bacterium GWE2_31_10]OHD47524.1 MAG: hypothetical protein A2015_02895 [Spirochaetes bacterium GWF1_31_7]
MDIILNRFALQYKNSGDSLIRFVKVLVIYNLIMIVLLSGVALSYIISRVVGYERAIASSIILIMVIIISLVMIYAGKCKQSITFYFYTTAILIVAGRFIQAFSTPESAFTSYIYYYYYLIVYVAVFGRKVMIPIISILFIITNFAAYYIARDLVEPSHLAVLKTGIFNSVPALIITFVIAYVNIWLTDKKTEDIISRNKKLIQENEKNLALQLIIRQYIPKTTWEKADLNSNNAILEILQEDRDLSCFFVDIVDFTSFAESHTPTEVVKMLNETFHPLVDIIYQHNGDIDKFIGDCIFAIFQDSNDCFNAAIQIQEAMKKSKFEVRISINTGKVIIGNVGGKNRKDNTLIGDTVNTASRLEKICHPGELIITDAFWRSLSVHCAPYATESVNLKGKDIATIIHRVKCS